MQPETLTITAPATPAVAAKARVRRAQEDPAWVRWTLSGVAVLTVTILIVIPVVNVFAEAFAAGPGAYWKNLWEDADTRQAIVLTLTVVPIALTANVVFGVAAAWAISRFNFRGRALL